MGFNLHLLKKQKQLIMYVQSARKDNMNSSNHIFLYFKVHPNMALTTEERVFLFEHVF